MKIEIEIKNRNGKSKLEIEIEMKNFNWKSKLEIEIEIKNFNWKSKIEIINWNWKFTPWPTISCKTRGKEIGANIRTTHHGWEPWYVDRTERKQHLSGSWFVDRAKGKQYGSGFWLIVANVQFHVILGHSYILES